MSMTSDRVSLLGAASINTLQKQLGNKADEVYDWSRAVAKLGPGDENHLRLADATPNGE
jgi:hypothetical protein